MKNIRWDKQKNELLKKERNISFEIVMEHFANGNIVDIIENPNNLDYLGQKLVLINVDNYIYYVPFVETDTEIFLKTIIPSRKFTKKYLGVEK